MIIAVPPAPAPPVNKPVFKPIVATTVLLLLQVPSVIASLSVVDVPAQILVVPNITGGSVFTVIVTLVEQPPAI